jgi:hypothetical protein
MYAPRPPTWINATARSPSAVRWSVSINVNEATGPIDVDPSKCSIVSLDFIDQRQFLNTLRTTTALCFNDEVRFLHVEFDTPFLVKQLLRQMLVVGNADENGWRVRAERPGLI